MSSNMSMGMPSQSPQGYDNSISPMGHTLAHPSQGYDNYGQMADTGGSPEHNSPENQYHQFASGDDSRNRGYQKRKSRGGLHHYAR